MHVIVTFHSSQLLQPDQALDAIVDAALALGKPFAVVPCCVFSREFPNRRLSGERAVTTRDDLIEYIQEKDPGIERAVLKCPGANVVLWKVETESACEGCEGSGGAEGEGLVMAGEVGLEGDQGAGSGPLWAGPS